MPVQVRISAISCAKRQVDQWFLWRMKILVSSVQRRRELNWRSLPPCRQRRAHTARAEYGFVLGERLRGPHRFPGVVFAIDGRSHVRLCPPDRKSTRLNSSHLGISYAVFCLKKKKRHNHLAELDL